MELLKLLSTNEIIAQVIGFLTLLFLLRIFAWKRILSLLDERRERIASEFKRIEEQKAELSQLKAEYELNLRSIEEQAQKKIHEAVEEGKKITEDIIQKAHQESQSIIDNARNNIKYELSKSKEELKNQIIDLTLSAVENVVQEKLTGEGDRKLIDDFLEKLDKAE